MFGIGRTFKKVFGDTGSKVLLGVGLGALTGGVAAGAFGATGLGIGATASTLGVSTTTAGTLLGGAYGGTAALLGAKMAKMGKSPSAASLLPDDSGSAAMASTTSESSTGTADSYAARRKAGFHFGRTLLGG